MKREKSSGTPIVSQNAPLEIFLEARRSQIARRASSLRLRHRHPAPPEERLSGIKKDRPAGDAVLGLAGFTKLGLLWIFFVETTKDPARRAESHSAGSMAS